MFKMARKILTFDGRSGGDGTATSSSSSVGQTKSKTKDRQATDGSSNSKCQSTSSSNNKTTTGDELNDFSKLEQDPRIPLNVRQIFKITKSWKAIARTMSKTGTAMFLNLFEQNQDLFYLFDRFQHLKGTELHESMELREHAATVMSTLDQSINSLSDYDNFVSYLHSIGKLHHKVPGFKRAHFWKIEQPFMKAVKQTLDERCNETIEEIYKIAIKLIIETIADGYGEDVEPAAGGAAKGARDGSGGAAHSDSAASNDDAKGGGGGGASGASGGANLKPEGNGSSNGGGDNRASGGQQRQASGAQQPTKQSGCCLCPTPAEASKLNSLALSLADCKQQVALNHERAAERRTPVGCWQDRRVSSSACREEPAIGAQVNDGTHKEEATKTITKAADSTDCFASDSVGVCQEESCQQVVEMLGDSCGVGCANSETSTREDRVRDALFVLRQILLSLSKTMASQPSEPPTTTTRGCADEAHAEHLKQKLLSLDGDVQLERRRNDADKWFVSRKRRTLASRTIDSSAEEANSKLLLPSRPMKLNSRPKQRRQQQKQQQQQWEKPLKLAGSEVIIVVGAKDKVAEQLIQTTTTQSLLTTSAKRTTEEATMTTVEMTAELAAASSAARWLRDIENKSKINKSISESDDEERRPRSLSAAAPAPMSLVATNSYPEEPSDPEEPNGRRSQLESSSRCCRYSHRRLTSGQALGDRHLPVATGDGQSGIGANNSGITATGHPSAAAARLLEDYYSRQHQHQQPQQRLQSSTLQLAGGAASAQSQQPISSGELDGTRDQGNEQTEAHELHVSHQRQQSSSPCLDISCRPMSESDDKRKARGSSDEQQQQQLKGKTKTTTKMETRKLSNCLYNFRSKSRATSNKTKQEVELKRRADNENSAQTTNSLPAQEKPSAGFEALLSLDLGDLSELIKMLMISSSLASKRLMSRKQSTCDAGEENQELRPAVGSKLVAN